MQTGIAREIRRQPEGIEVTLAASIGRSRGHRSDLSVENSESAECPLAGGVGDLDLALVAVLATGGQQQLDKINKEVGWKKPNCSRRVERARSTFFKGIRRFVSSLRPANVPDPQDLKVKARVLADQGEEEGGQ